MFFQIAKTLAKSNLPLANVPTKYYEFTKLFLEKFENGLSKYGFYNYKIPLREGIALKFHQIYGLNENQLQAFREYLDENFKKGYI